MPLLAAAMAGFGHAVSEVGAATIVGGNIHGQTQVMTTAIVEDVGKGDFTTALVYAAILLGARVRDQCRAHVGPAARRPRGRSREPSRRPPPPRRARGAELSTGSTSRAGERLARARPERRRQDDAAAAPGRRSTRPTVGTVERGRRRPYRGRRFGPSAPHRLRDAAAGPALDQRDPERRAAAALAGCSTGRPAACAQPPLRSSDWASRHLARPQGATRSRAARRSGSASHAPSRCEPELLLLDEPAAGLDTEAAPSVLRRSRTCALSDRATTVVPRVAPRRGGAAYWQTESAVLSGGRSGRSASRASVVQHPSDANVARLVGYENVLQVHVDDSGQVLVDGTKSGATATTGAGAATLAAWGRAIHVTRSDASPLQATVERLSQGPGRWDLILTGPAMLYAHLPLDERPPQVGDRVGVRIDAAHATVIARSATAHADARSAGRSSPGR